jgi:hypothetical protein
MYFTLINMPCYFKLVFNAFALLQQQVFGIIILAQYIAKLFLFEFPTIV